MGNTLEKKKKGFSLPHVYIVILILMLIITAMTYIIPAGTYARDAVTGAVDPDNFTYIDQTPVGFLQFFTSLHQGIVESSNIIGSVLLISGCIQIINMTGAFSAGIQAMIASRYSDTNVRVHTEKSTDRLVDAINSMSHK